MRRLMTTALVVALVSTPAAAATRQTIYATGPSRVVNSLAVDAQEGDEFLIHARMQAEDATARILAELQLFCVSTEPELRTTQNMVGGQDVLVLHGRYVFTAPSDGLFNCRLAARAVMPGGVPNDVEHFDVDVDASWLTVTPQPSWVRHDWHGGGPFVRSDATLIPRGRARDVAVLNFTAPSGVAGFDAIADVEFTNCYDASWECDTSPTNRNSSTVETQLQAMQRAAGGGYCRITRSEKRTTRITRDIHHRKTYHELSSVPVSGVAGCTRSFRLKVYTRVTAGNDALVEMNPYTKVIAASKTVPAVQRPGVERLAVRRGQTTSR